MTTHFGGKDSGVDAPDSSPDRTNFLLNGNSPFGPR